MAFPSTFAGSLQITGTSKITNVSTGSAPSDALTIGQNGFGAINLVATQAAAAGATGQAKGHYDAQVTLAASGTGSVALTGFTDNLGDAISLTNVKMVLASVQATSVGSGKRVAMGALGVANGWYSPFSAVTTNGATLAGVQFTEVALLGSTLATTGYTAGAGNYGLNFQETAGTTTVVQLLIWGN